MSLTLTPLKDVPLINAGDNIAKLIQESLERDEIQLENNDILVITQKIISKAENRLVNVHEIKPSKKAFRISRRSNKSPALIELILRESKEIVRLTKSTIIVKHKLGFICANAGIDHSNVKNESKGKENWYLLLPEDPSKSAEEIRRVIHASSGKNIGVIIIDSQGRPWRFGTVGMTIGCANVPTLVDLRGKTDIFGYRLKISVVAASDELAAAASLIMGQADESIPVVHVRGFPYELRDSSMQEIIRPKEKDLFR